MFIRCKWSLVLFPSSAKFRCLLHFRSRPPEKSFTCFIQSCQTCIFSEAFKTANEKHDPDGARLDTDDRRVTVRWWLEVRFTEHLQRSDFRAQGGPLSSQTGYLATGLQAEMLGWHPARTFNNAIQGPPEHSPLCQGARQVSRW